MSLESALEEERLEILKLLERPSNNKSPPPTTRTQFGHSSPPLLPSLHARTTSPTRGKVISLIDAASPPPSHRSPSQSPTLRFSSPTSNGVPFRPRHDSTSSNGAPRLLRDLDKPDSSSAFAPHDGYRFEMLPSISSQAAPKRVTQGPPIRSMLDDRFTDKGKMAKRSGSPTTNAALRHAQLRSASPRPGWGTDSARSSTGRLSSPPPGNKNYLTSENGHEIDLDHAYRRLNDEALARSGGVLGSLPEKRAVSNEEMRGGERLQKDYDYPAGSEKAIVDSSDEDTSDDGEDTTSGEGKSDDESGKRRGRRKKRSENGDGPSDSEDDAVKKMQGSLGGKDPGGGGRAGGRTFSSLLSIGGKKKTGSSTGKPKKTMSLLAAAEEERKEVSSRYKVRSLLPSISVTQAGNISSSVPSSPVSVRRSGVCPSTNFDLPSHASTPMSSDTEADFRDLRRAQRMETKLSAISSTPETHRVVRTITRGDFDMLQDEAEQGKRRQRSYLVATDMSSEAAHALEWTIGTVLRDGDTLLAIYAVDEDSQEISGAGIMNGCNGSTTADGKLLEVSTHTQASLVGLIPPSSPSLSSASLGGTASAVPSIPSSPLAGFSTPASRASTPPPAVSRRGSGEKKRGNSKERNKAELERIQATESITTLICKLLKKTRLQVRCVVEVIHCKSPKHLLTEVIDYIEPTLVILGSRGRSALKGVLLGSFSNYLVTKSSVPVMVARRKLKQPKYKKKKGVYANGPGGNGGVNVRLANNLVPGLVRTNSGGLLASAKID